MNTTGMCHLNYYRHIESVLLFSTVCNMEGGDVEWRQLCHRGILYCHDTNIPDVHVHSSRILYVSDVFCYVGNLNLKR